MSERPSFNWQGHANLISLAAGALLIAGLPVGPGGIAASASEHQSLSAIGVVPLLVVADESATEPSGKDKDKEKDPEIQALPPSSPTDLSPAEQYCSNALDAAAAAQLAQQKSNLEKAQRELDERIALLAMRTADLKGWIKKREDFTAHATNSLVQIYSKMKPDAAAVQLMAMDELIAAAIMFKMSPKANSLILAEMDATKAAHLSSVIANAGEIALKPEQRADAH